MDTDVVICRFYGRGYANRNFWICLSCLEGLLDETLGFIHTVENPGPASGTSMGDLSPRIVGEARTHQLRIKKGNKTVLNKTGLYELSIPQVSPCSPVAVCYIFTLLLPAFPLLSFARL